MIETGKRSPITAGQLYQFLDRALTSGALSTDTIVEIETGEPSMGPTAASNIRSVTMGFDWDAGRLLVTPSDTLFKGHNA